MSTGGDRVVRVADIGGLAEVCEVIGYSDGYVTQLLADSSTGFPQPIVPIKAGRLWDLSEVREWKRIWGQREHRRPGPAPGTLVRPPKVESARLSAADRAAAVDALLGRA